MTQQTDNEAARRATSYDVAALAGVSQSAVSRCFKPGASISGKTREKVLKAAKALKYKPNAIARSLITQRSHMAGVIVSAQLNFYYPDVLFQLTEKFAAQHMRVLLFTVNQPEDMDRALDEMWRYQIDGVISASYLSRAQYALLRERGTPTVLFNRSFSDLETHTVWCDPSAAVNALVDDLTTKEHRRFAMLEGPADSQVNMVRKRAVISALETHGLQLAGTARGDYRYESAAAAVDTLLSGNQDVTAIICANDMMAMGAIDHLQSHHNRPVPAAISVCGFDGISAGQFASYKLTTVQQPISAMAEQAVTTLLEDIDGSAPNLEQRALPGTLVPGNTTGQAPS